LAGRDAWKSEPARGSARGADRSSHDRREERGAPLGSRASPRVRGAISPRRRTGDTGTPNTGLRRGIVSEGYRDRASAEREVARAARRDESESPSSEAGQEGRSAPNAGRHIRLVHRGVRYCGPEGREGATRRAVVKS